MLRFLIRDYFFPQKITIILFLMKTKKKEEMPGCDFSSNSSLLSAVFSELLLLSQKNICRDRQTYRKNDKQIMHPVLFFVLVLLIRLN